MSSAPRPTTRDEFLQTIRNALGPRSARPQPPEVNDELVRLASADEDLAAAFCERAAAVGMFVRRTTEAGLPTQLLDVLRQIQAKSVTLAVDRLSQKDLLLTALVKAGIEVRDWERDRSMASHYEVDAGVSDVHAAIAETGTLVCCSDATHGRGHSLVPPNHVAIVRRSDLLADLLDYVANLRPSHPQEFPSAVALITGPSKTADIEGILITGVHGPGRVDVLFVEDQ